MPDGSIMRLRQLQEYIKLSRSAIYERMNEKSKRYDKSFPKPIRLGGGGAIGWFKSDIDAWLANCTRNGVAPQTQLLSQTLTGGEVTLQTTNKAPAPPTVVSRTAASPAPTSNTPPASKPADFVDLIIEGRERNKLLIEYLRLDIWTPAMATLLMCGIQPPIGCKNIPLDGMDLNNQKLHANDKRVRLARRMLDDWLELDPPPSDMRPIDFIVRCDEEGINTEWFRLMLNLMGNETLETTDLSASHFALKIDQQR